MSKAKSWFTMFLMVSSFVFLALIIAGAAKGKEIKIASFYGWDFAGKQTANGEEFNPMALTAAHKTLPFDTKVLVENLDNGKKVVVRINDRGPYIDGRDIDLSRQAAQTINMVDSGVAKVKITILEVGNA